MNHVHGYLYKYIESMYTWYMYNDYTILIERKTAGEQSAGGTKSPFDKLERL